MPTTLMRQGNFSELLNPNNIFYGKPVVIYDPATCSHSGSVFSSAGCQAFPGNIIPANRLSQNGLGILKAYPGPNLTAPINGNQLFYVTALHPQNQRKDTLAVDINITDRQRLQFRRNNYAFFEYQPLDGTPTETPKFFNRPNQTNSLDHVWTISPTMVNEVLATVSLDDVYIPVDEANFFDRTTAGINYPYLFPQGKLIPTRIPTANITGLTGLTGGPYPSHSSGPIYTLTDSLTWIKGSHTFKFGFYFERSGENDNDEINVSACPTCTNNQNGQFTFTDTNPFGAGNAIANTALGLFDSYSELGQRAYTIFRGSSYEPYAQDSWKVTPRLTVNYGRSVHHRRSVQRGMAKHDRFRSHPVQPRHGLLGQSKDRRGDCRERLRPVRRHGNSGQWLAGFGQGPLPRSHGRHLRLSVPQRQLSSYYSNIQWGQWQPRLGLAYNIGDKTVIRAGAGRFYTRLGVSDSIFLGGNPPFQPTANVSYGLADNPGGTSANSLPLTVTTQSRAFKNPEAWNWNFTVERQIGFKSVLTVAYVGRRGLHLQREANINQPLAGTLQANAGANIDALRPSQAITRPARQTM